LESIPKVLKFGLRRDNILDGEKEGRAGEVVECERGCLNKMESIGKRSSKNIQYPNEIERV
jgi:hypothetical protein